MKTGISALTIVGSQVVRTLVILVFLLTGSSVFSQNIESKASRKSSFEAFSKGDYEKAFHEFSELLITYPEDPLYKYYSGVCLIRLNRNAEEAVTLLTQAQKRATIVRTIPSDANFWLGRAQQLSGDFTGALESYNLFTELAGKKTAKELDVPSFIQQCKDKRGGMAETIPVTVVKAHIDNSSSKKEGKMVSTRNIAGQNENRINPGNETLPVDYDKLLSEALDYQYRADSVYKIAGELKKNLENTVYREKSELRTRIAATENTAASFQKIADLKYAEAEARMNAIPPDKEAVNTPKIIMSADSMKTVKHEVVATVQKTQSAIRKDTFKVVPDTLRQNQNIEKTVKIPSAVFSLFEADGKTADAPGGKIVIDPEIPEGMIYRIQIAVFRNPVLPSYFKGLSPVNGFRVPGTDKTNYYVGMFRRITDANKALLKVRQKGFKDAFIVSLSGGKPVSAERASLLEKEWGKKPLVTGIKSTPEITADTLPPTLSFRVEVTRAAKPVKDDILAGMRKMAGGRGLNIEILGKGTFVYLIGTFITYESAEDFAGLLARNGYRDAKVVAWLGKKEIPVDTARQLFEKIE